MKRLLFALFLLVSAGSLFANDEGADPGYIPDYQTLVREGYGPRTTVTRVEYDNPEFLEVLPKPTQAYYGRGYTIYYGFTPIVLWQKYAQTTFAFGHTLAYFRQLMPQGLDETNLSHYALEVPKNNFEPGTYIAGQPVEQPATVTAVQKINTNAATASPATGTATLPAIGEKPAH
jgi:hypothetical protein